MMNIVKSKHILVISVLSIFLVQIINSVYSPAAKPAAKPVAKPAAKPVAKPTVQIPKAIPAKPVAPKKNPTSTVRLKTAESIQLTAPLENIRLVGTSEESDLSSNKALVIEALNQGKTFSVMVYDNTLSLISSDNTRLSAVGRFITGPKYLSYQYQGSTEYINVPVQNGTQVTIIGKLTFTIINLPPNITNIQVYTKMNPGVLCKTYDTDKTNLITALNKGHTFTGQLSGGTLPLTDTTTNQTYTLCFEGKPLSIEYFYGTTNSQLVNIPNTETPITINGTSSLPNEFTITLTKRIINIKLIDANSDFTNKSDLIQALNNGQTFTGNIDYQGNVTLTNSDKLITSQCSFLNGVPTSISYQYEYDTTDHNQQVEKEATITIIGYQPAPTPFQSNPFITMNMYNQLSDADKANVKFFSQFNNALAISSLSIPSNPRTTSVDNPNLFFTTITDNINTIYVQDWIRPRPHPDASTVFHYTPLFNAPRFIYGQFSQKGTILTFYSDSNYQNAIGTFTLASPKATEYISQLLLYTDAYMPKNPTNDPRVNTNGNIVTTIIFDKITAQNNTKFNLELINPNDNAYQNLSQITNFTNLTFRDSNKNSIQIPSSITDRLNDIYGCINNNTIATSITNLLNQAWLKPCRNDYDCNYYSDGYHPRILISANNQQINFALSYNVMLLWWSDGWFSSDDAMSYQEQERNEYYKQPTTLNNIESIMYNGLTLNLNAPIKNNQIFFYLDTGFNKDGSVTSWDRRRLQKNDNAENCTCSTA